MKVAVYDTYVVKKNGETAHFDVVVPTDETPERVLDFGREFLKGIGQEGQPLTTKECQFCHVESASEAIQRSVQQQGYFIKEMEGCR